MTGAGAWSAGFASANVDGMRFYDDILVPPRFSRALAAAVPRAELRLIDGAGHCYFWERPDIFNEMCLDFLAHASV